MYKEMSKNKTNELFCDEQGFNLPLETEIEGVNATGEKFKEKTVLSYISHKGSSFWLSNLVKSGSELRLAINLPPKLSEEKRLKLIIKGKVIFVEAIRSEATQQRVTLKFESRYIIEEKNQ